MEARKLAKDNRLFLDAHQQLEALVVRLQSDECMAMTHSQAEGVVDVMGREVLRRVYQGYLAQRSEVEVRRPVVGAHDGTARTHVRRRRRLLTSVFGEVTVERLCYGQRGMESLSVLDAELNLPPESFSLGVRRLVAIEASKCSFDETIVAVESMTGVDIPKRQAEELARRAGADFDAFYEQRKPAANVETGEVLVMTTDGKGVSMRRGDLRPATRKEASRRSHKLKKRLSKGEKTATRRMAQVAAVYTIQRFVRTAEDIAGTLGPTPGAEREAPRRPRPEHKRVWASITKDAHDVIGEAFAEAARRDPARMKDWVVLVDGGEHQLDCVLEWASRSGTHVTVILDIIHVLEYLWGAARALHGEGRPETEEYVTERLLRILRGKSSDVAAGMRRSATKRGLTASVREPIDKCADYLLKYSEYLRYDEYLAAGYPISTGVIEGACRYLVKDRMDITGARWSTPGAEAVLRLRAARASGDFDAYWAFHEARELDRNHLSSYANHAIPPAPPPISRRNPTLRVVQ